MASSSADTMNYEEVAEYCGTCVFSLINFHKTRCEFKFDGKAQKCALCARRNNGAEKPCVPVCEALKAKAARLCASAKQFSHLDEELDTLLKKMEDMFDENKKKKIQPMIDDCKERHDAAAKAYKDNAAAFKAGVKKVGNLDKVLEQGKQEALDANPTDKKIIKTRAPQPAEPQLSDGQKLILGLRDAVKAADDTRNKQLKACHLARATYKGNNFTAEEKDKVENLFRKLDRKMDKMRVHQHKFMNWLEIEDQVDQGAALRYDSGDEDLSDVEGGPAEDGNCKNGDGGMSAPQGGDVDMMDTA